MLYISIDAELTTELWRLFNVRHHIIIPGVPDLMSLLETGLYEMKFGVGTPFVFNMKFLPQQINIFNNYFTH